MFHGCAKNIYRNIYDLKQGIGLKILSPKQMIQRLPLLLSEISAGNSSDSLLNEIRQIVYLCINQKRLPKKYIIT